jgi:GNAT superfamily N-acetyltransferase
MEIRRAVSDAEKRACYPALHALRPHVAAEGFLQRIREQERSGYRLVYGQAEDGVVAVAGFRVLENLAFGRFLYIDDLVTDPACRSRGYGSRLLSWLRERAARERCAQLHLDSGLARADAHRFYEREGLVKGGFHFYAEI